MYQWLLGIEQIVINKIIIISLGESSECTKVV